MNWAEWEEDKCKFLGLSAFKSLNKTVMYPSWCYNILSSMGIPKRKSEHSSKNCFLKNNISKSVVYKESF